MEKEEKKTHAVSGVCVDRTIVVAFHQLLFAGIFTLAHAFFSVERNLALPYNIAHDHLTVSIDY